MSDRITLTLDAKPSARSYDENGFLHVAVSHITKATVNPYYGREIPNSEEAGYEPDEIYYGLRDPDELEKSLDTWKGLPLHVEHHIDSANEPEKLTRVGSVGTEVEWRAPYIDAPLTVWDAKAIKAIEDGSLKELSCAYRYDPKFKKGTYEGADYDFVMTNIRGNHVALVEEGRVGPDVVVADSNTIKPAEEGGEGVEVMDDKNMDKKVLELAQAIISLHEVDPETGEIEDVTTDEDRREVIKKILNALLKQLKPEDYDALKEAIEGLSMSEDEDVEGEGHDVPKPTPVYQNADEEDEELPPSQERESIALPEDEEPADEFPLKKKLFPLTKEDGTEGDAEESTEDVKTKTAVAQDSIIRRSIAQDAAFISRVKREVTAQIQGKYRAAEKVRPLVGGLNAMGFDSAEDIYRSALEQNGIDARKYPKAAWAGMVDILLSQKKRGLVTGDGAAKSNRGGIELNGLDNIIIS